MTLSGFCVLCVLSARSVTVPARSVSGSAPSSQQAIAGQPTTQETLDRIRSDLFARAEHLDEDIRALKQILASDPRSAEGHSLLGIAYRIQGSPDLIAESVAEFRQALDLNPGLVPVRYYLARVYLDLGRVQRAREELEAALAQAPGSPEFLALLGETERQLKNPGRAAEVIRQALQADESSQQAHYYLALALFDLGQRDAAITELEGVVRSGPQAADPYLALGTAYLDAGRVSDALETLGEGTRIDPSQRELHILLARAYRTSGSLEKAEAQLALAAPKRGTAASSGSRGASANASDSHVGASTSDYQNQKVELDFYLERGLVKLQRGQLTAARDAFKKVLEMDPNNDQATRGLAEVTRKQKAGGRQ